MYKIEKRFTFPMGHRLSKHKGRCKNIHGHNFTVLVGLKATHLDENDMVMDFSDLKQIVNIFLDQLDHCTMLNGEDTEFNKFLDAMEMKVIRVAHDPTAEKLAELLYIRMQGQLPSNVSMDYVTVYENENSKATYCIEIDTVIH